MEVLQKEGLLENITQTANFIKKKIEEAKTELKTAISGVYRPKGSVQDFASLPEEKEIGDVYDVKEAYGDNPPGTNYVWTGTEWDALGGMVDLSPYAKTSDMNAKLTEKLNSKDLTAISSEDIQQMWEEME